MGGISTTKRIVLHPFFSLIFCLSVWFILPRYGGIAVMLPCASLLSLHIAVLPELYRSRSGSMMAATCLVAAMWVGAAFVTALTLTGEFRG